MVYNNINHFDEHNIEILDIEVSKNVTALNKANQIVDTTLYNNGFYTDDEEVAVTKQIREFIKSN